MRIVYCNFCEKKIKEVRDGVSYRKDIYVRVFHSNSMSNWFEKSFYDICDSCSKKIISQIKKACEVKND